MSGYGILPYGIGAYGAVSIESARAFDTNTVFVELTSPVMALFPYKTGDALNPLTWQLQNLTTCLRNRQINQ